MGGLGLTSGIIEGAQKFVIYGPEGIGKSTLASKFPNVIFIDTEGSTKRLDVLRYRPTSWAMMLEQIKEVINYVKSTPQMTYGTLALDTADWAEKLCKEQICSKSQKTGIEDFGYGKGYTYLAEEYGRMLNLLEELIELGINVTLVAHAQMRKFEQPDEIGSYDRWELKLEKKVAPLVKEWADIILFCNYKTYIVNVDNQGAAKGKNKAQGGERVMYTSHHPCWDAKNRHDLAPELKLDYNEIKHCVFTKKAQPVAAVTIPVPVPKQSSPPESKPVKTEPQQSEITEADAEAVYSSFHESVNTVVNKIASNQPPKDDLKNIPKALADLMTTNNVTVQEIQQVVGARGYYPVDTPISNYDPQFINGVLVAAWPQVFAMIQKNRG